MRTSVKIGSVWGIPIRIHISLVALLVLVAIAAATVGGLGGIFWNLAVLVLVFASIALHELAHSLVAIRKGCRVRDITLLFIGGAAQMEEIPRRPADEIQMAMAGPLFSLAIAALGLGLGPLLSLPPLLPSLWSSRPINLVQFAGQVNLTLALFNLLPAFPMDGGRILRALLSRRIGRLPATFVASRLGRLAAILMGLAALRYGFWQLVIIAVFLFRAAGREFELVLNESILSAFFPDAPTAEEEDEEEVHIGPPPYGRSPPSCAPLERDWL
jgi:Zn-dependent protease